VQRNGSRAGGTASSRKSSTHNSTAAVPVDKLRDPRETERARTAAAAAAAAA
jgi:hypothetical protein